MAYIFGYGSLVDIIQLSKFLKKEISYINYSYETLHGYKRNFAVSMDNREKIDGYKNYYDFEENLINGFVSFLNIEECPKSSIFGILFEVNNNELIIIDNRELNYDRIDISKSFEEKNVKVFTYISSQEGFDRFSFGVANNSVFIQEEYLEAVLMSYKKMSLQHLINFIKSTDFQNIPIVSMTRIDNK